MMEWRMRNHSSRSLFSDKSGHCLLSSLWKVLFLLINRAVHNSTQQVDEDKLFITSPRARVQTCSFLSLSKRGVIEPGRRNEYLECPAPFPYLGTSGDEGDTQQFFQLCSIPYEQADLRNKRKQNLLTEISVFLSLQHRIFGLEFF